MSQAMQNLVAFRNAMITAFDKKQFVSVPIKEKAGVLNAMQHGGISQFRIFPVTGPADKFTFKVFLSGHMSGEITDLDMDFHGVPYTGNVLDNKPSTTRDNDFDLDDDNDGCTLDGDDDPDNF